LLRPDTLKNCYAILDLSPGATEEEVRDAYLDLVKVWHPDRYSHESPRLRKRAEEKLRLLNEAYERIRSGAPDPIEPEPASEPAHEGISALTVLLFPKNFGDRWGYVNAPGQMVISPQFDFAAPFIDGVARVRERGHWGFIDRIGRHVIAPGFSTPATSPKAWPRWCSARSGVTSTRRAPTS
jgi:hypothetical protein